MRAFTSLRRSVRRFLAAESGATAVEYAVLVGAVVLTCAAAAAAFQVLAGLAFEGSTTTLGTYPDP